MRAALEANGYIEALFWDYASLYQGDRTPEQNALFFQALSVMGDLYASAVGTTVLQLKEIPPRPKEFDGALALFSLADGVDEAKIRAAFSRFGVVESVEIRDSQPPAIVRLSTHEAALTAIKAGAPEGICDGIDTLYNERSYDGRKDKEELDDDTGRGWCQLEGSVSGEAVLRLQEYPKMEAELNKLPPKVLTLSSNHAARPKELKASGGQHVKQVFELIQNAKFTGKGDKERVVAMYKDYAMRIARVLQGTLAFAAGGDDAGALMLAHSFAVVSNPTFWQPIFDSMRDSIVKGC